MDDYRAERQQEKRKLVCRISEPPVGAFYWADGEDLDRIHKFEQEYIRLAAERDIYKSQYDWLLNRFLGSD